MKISSNYQKFREIRIFKTDLKILGFFFFLYSINALDSLNDDPPHQVENAIRKYQQDTMKQLIHFQSDKNVEFRTTKPSDGLQQSKKICKEYY